MENKEKDAMDLATEAELAVISTEGVSLSSDRAWSVVEARGDTKKL